MEAVSLGLIGSFAGLLKTINDDEIQIEILWTLTNIGGSCDEYSAMISETNIQHFIVELLKTHSIVLKEQCLWCLGNIISNSIKTRDEMLATDLLDRLYEILILPKISESLMDVTCWVFSNLSRGRPSPPLAKFMRLLPFLKMMLNYQSANASNDTLWSISYLTDRNTPDKTQIFKYIDFDFVVKAISSEEIGRAHV